MRIVNVRPEHRYYSYAGTSGGRSLRPGEFSPELPLERIFNAQLLVDMGKNYIQIKLSDEDKAFLKKLSKHDAMPIAVQQLPQPTPPPKPVKAPKPQPPRPQTPKPPMNKPGTPVGQPEIVPQPGKMDLAALRRHNTLLLEPKI